jgi:hypothetical protein
MTFLLEFGFARLENLPFGNKKAPPGPMRQGSFHSLRNLPVASKSNGGILQGIVICGQVQYPFFRSVFV